jgi:hypothetical protein
LLGENVKRVDGRTLGTFFAEEVAGPLGADFHIGTPVACDPRVARVIGSGPIDAGDDPTSIPCRTWTVLPRTWPGRVGWFAGDHQPGCEMSFGYVMNRMIAGSAVPIGVQERSEVCAPIRRSGALGKGRYRGSGSRRRAGCRAPSTPALWRHHLNSSSYVMLA